MIGHDGEHNDIVQERREFHKGTTSTILTSAQLTRNISYAELAETARDAEARNFLVGTAQVEEELKLFLIMGVKVTYVKLFAVPDGPL